MAGSTPHPARSIKTNRQRVYKQVRVPPQVSIGSYSTITVRLEVLDWALAPVAVKARVKLPLPGQIVRV
jgi:hypothetical protein